jgi:glutathione peroxidase
MTSLYDIPVAWPDGTEDTLARFRDQVLLIVNTASRCGFTPQYAGLEGLHRAYTPSGFRVLGFPCNQFGRQEPGDAVEIGRVCNLYDVTFPVFAKIEVNGDRAHPLYRVLKAARPGFLGLGRIGWNFTKFLVNRDGAVVGRFAPMTRPEALGTQIARWL